MSFNTNYLKVIKPGQLKVVSGLKKSKICVSRTTLKSDVKLDAELQQTGAK